MDYDQCILLISSMEANDADVRTTQIDIYDLGQEVNIRTYEPVEAEKLIDSIGSTEGGIILSHVSREPEAKKAPVQQPVPTAATVAVPAGKPSAQKAPGQSMAERIGAVADELESELEAVEKFVSGHKKKSDLVLPTLSLQDQANELEKIEVGLESSAFSDAQIAIIKKEVAGLKKAHVVAADEFQRNLLGARNMRIKEISVRLGI